MLERLCYREKVKRDVKETRWELNELRLERGIEEYRTFEAILSFSNKICYKTLTLKPLNVCPP